MGSAEEEIKSENTLSLVSEDEVNTSVSFVYSDQLKDKNIEYKDANVASELPMDCTKPGQTKDSENITSEVNELKSEGTSSINQKSTTLLDARDDDVELQQSSKIQSYLDEVTECIESVGIDGNKSLPNCDTLPATTELQRNDVQSVDSISGSGLASNVADDSGLVEKTSSGQQHDEITFASYQRRSTLPRVHASGGRLQTTNESGSTHWMAVVPLINDHQYSFR